MHKHILVHPQETGGRGVETASAFLYVYIHITNSKQNSFKLQTVEGSVATAAASAAAAANAIGRRGDAGVGVSRQSAGARDLKLQIPERYVQCEL